LEKVKAGRIIDEGGKNGTSLEGQTNKKEKHCWEGRKEPPKV